MVYQSKLHASSDRTQNEFDFGYELLGYTMRYSIELRDQICVKNYGFLFSAKKHGEKSEE